jgi:hypothetical protein
VEGAQLDEQGSGELGSVFRITDDGHDPQAVEIHRDGSQREDLVRAHDPLSLMQQIGFVLGQGIAG